MKPNFSNFATVAPLYFQPAKGQIYSDLAGELAILDSRSGIYYGLDPVGARIWNLLLDWKSLSDIRSILLDEYDVEPWQLETDIAHLFDDLFSKGLIEVAPPNAKPARSREAVSGLR